MPNKVGDKMLPCGTPCSCLNMSDNVLPFRTLNRNIFYVTNLSQSNIFLSLVLNLITFAQSILK